MTKFVHARTKSMVGAYGATNYVVIDKRQEVILRIGERSAVVDALLSRYHARSAVFVTAFNPLSRLRSRSVNLGANRCLAAGLTSKKITFLRGEGRPDQTGWLPEASFMVFGIDERRAAGLGRAWRQNAVVFVQLGRAPRLLSLV